jgi:hypothetical protein
LHVQAAVAAALGDPPLTDETAPRSFNPLYDGPALREQRELAAMRKRAAQLCLLREPSLAPALGDPAGVYRAHLARPAFGDWTRVANVPPALAGTHTVRDVLMSRNGTRFYRVLMTVPDDPAWTETGHKPAPPYHVAPVIVPETLLMAAVAEWARHLADHAIGDASTPYPCLCAAHLGLVGSGLFFWRDPGQVWHLLVDAQIQHQVILDPDHLPTSRFLWPKYTLRFPIDVDPRFNVSDVTHANMVDVAYIDPAAITRAAIVAVDPTWLTAEVPAADAPPVVGEKADDENTGFASVMALRALQPFGHGQRFMDNDNICFQHCWAIEQRSLERLRKRALLPAPGASKG